MADNPAITLATQLAERVAFVFIHAPDEASPWQPGAASNWWLHHSLIAFNQSLAPSQRLIVRRGDSLATLQQLIKETRASCVVWNRLYEPKLVARDTQIKQALGDDGVEVHSTHGALLFEPWAIKTKQDTPFKVFTPFWNACSLRLDTLAPPSKAPKRLPAPHELIDSEPIESLSLLPTLPWDSQFATHWSPGEAGAHGAVRRFVLHACEGYANGRDFPAMLSTSRLSPHLHFGEISPRQILAAVSALNESRQAQGKAAVIRQLGWRDFAHHLLFHFPNTPEQPFNPRFAEFKWRRNAKLLKAWQQGQTGIPIVDAGMRELWQTGIMHNRVRMLVASLLTKNLGIHWIEGARWFWDTLLDADLANNTLGWQWVAGCGADAAPYFRIFNPETQSQRFDSGGEYIRRWIPEIAQLTNRYIHSPSTAPNNILADAGITLGKHYPSAILDLKASRASALERYGIAATRARGN